VVVADSFDRFLTCRRLRGRYTIRLTLDLGEALDHRNTEGERLPVPVWAIRRRLYRLGDRNSCAGSARVTYLRRVNVSKSAGAIPREVKLTFWDSSLFMCDIVPRPSKYCI